MNNYQNILLPVDFSESNSIAAKRALELVKIYDAKVTLVHVINYLPPNYVSVALPAEFASKDFLMGKAKTKLSEWSAENGLGDCQQVVETGQPKKVIVNLMEKIGTDLIILSPHDETGLVQFFGSVTNAVAQNCKCDVLIVRVA